MSPSWKVHKEVCEKLLGFYNQEIDKIIDFEFSHDSSRYDVKELADVVNEVRNKYGSQGLKQFILHHYLDRLSDIIVREFIVYFDFYVSGYYTLEKSVLEFIEAVSEMIDKDPANILNLLIHPYDYLRYVTGILYSGKRKRKKRKEVKQRLAEAYDKLLQYPELKSLSPLISEIINLMKNNVEFILLSIFYNDKRIGNRIANSLTMKTLGEIWRNQSSQNNQAKNYFNKRALKKFYEYLFDYLLKNFY